MGFISHRSDAKQAEESGVRRVTVLSEGSAGDSVLVVPATPTGNSDQQVRIEEEDGSKALEDGIFVFFDSMVTVAKEGKKCRHKNLVFRNMAEFGGSLHNKTMRNAMKSKSKEMQVRGFRLAGHRQSISFSNNYVVAKIVKVRIL